MNRVCNTLWFPLGVFALAASAQTITPAALEGTLSASPYSISGANCGSNGLLFAGSSADGVINCTSLLTFNGNGFNVGRTAGGGAYGYFQSSASGGGINLSDDAGTLFQVYTYPGNATGMYMFTDNNHYPNGLSLGVNDFGATVDAFDSTSKGGVSILGSGAPDVIGTSDLGDELFSFSSQFVNTAGAFDGVGVMRLGDDAASSSEGVIVTGQLSNGLLLMQNGIDVQDVKLGEWGGSGPEPDGKLQLLSHTGSNPIVLDASSGNGTFSGSVGIGTATPTTRLEVNGGLKLTGSSGTITFPDGSVQSSAYGSTATNIYSNNGNVGVGTGTPQTNLEVYGWSQSGNGVALTLHNGSGESQQTSETSILFQGGSPSDEGIQTFAAIQSAGSDYSGNNGHLSFSTSQAGQMGTRMTIMPTGNVGIGTTAPASTLEVNGNVMLTHNSGASITFQDGTVQSTAYSGTCTTTGGDYAESVDVTGERNNYEPGQLMVIDPEHPGHFLVSSEPYSTLVAGIYSTKPGYVGRRQQGNPKLASSEVPMAMVGIVPTKVTADNGPIRVGDLLVTSSVSGYAMKGTDRSRMIGAVVGKAMGPLNSGTGVIEVLVSLQ